MTNSNSQLYTFAKRYFAKIEKERKALLELYPSLASPTVKKHRMSKKGRMNISKGIKTYWRNKKKLEKKNGEKS